MTLDAPSCVVSCPPAACFACPHPFLNSTPPCTAVICYLLPGAFVNICKFKITLADILETQCRAACGTLSWYQLPIQHIFWDVTITHVMHVAEPALTEEEVYAVRAQLQLVTTVLRSLFLEAINKNVNKTQADHTVNYDTDR